jgi:hypothetical protein
MQYVIDEIKSERIEKFEKFFLYCAIGTALLLAIKIYLNTAILTGEGEAIDYVLPLLPISSYYTFRKKTSKRKGQFIRWTEKTIDYKSDGTEDTIFLTDIQDIHISLDMIDLHLNDGTTHTINVQDYADYNDRIRIKDNFTKVLQGLKNNFHNRK